jgi:hypothetical protein
MTRAWVSQALDDLSVGNTFPGREILLVQVQIRVILRPDWSRKSGGSMRRLFVS